MPNWCSNRIEISVNTAEEMDEIEKSLFTSQDDDGVLTYTILLPEPDVLKGTISPPGKEGPRYEVLDAEGARTGDRLATPEELAEMNKVGYSNWYDWRHDHWGVKWDAQVRRGEFDTEAEDYLQLTFNSPWGPPTKWVEALREKFPNANITAFFDEPGIQAAGYY